MMYMISWEDGGGGGVRVTRNTPLGNKRFVRSTKGMERVPIKDPVAGGTLGAKNCQYNFNVCVRSPMLTQGH